MLRLLVFVLSICLLFCTSCSEWFEYSPYDTEIEDRHLNTIEATEILSNYSPSDVDTFKFAVLSDIHDCYDDLSQAVKSINKQADLSFILCCGDLTNSGLTSQYDWYVDIIDKSKIPVISMIGNHDYRSNGYAAYRKIFGYSNLTFTAGNYKFILFDNVIWENENRSPKYSWLSEELSDTLYFQVVCCHIPPWGDQMKGTHNRTFTSIVSSENTILCLHGHTHNYADTCYNGVRSLVSEAINAREYYIVSMAGKESRFTRVKY